mmetsp:Transcript_43074/g.138467  ORF Transcript_43074/g.138467 Transcript_43074/m.138467 type:complete len:692 (+) Transcript_43074:82-2157(+)
MPAVHAGAQLVGYVTVSESPLSWGQDRLGSWLAARGLPREITNTFEVHLVNGIMAASLSHADLAGMGILHPLHQRRVLCELHQLFTEWRPAPPAPGGRASAGAPQSARCRSPSRAQRPRSGSPHGGGLCGFSGGGPATARERSPYGTMPARQPYGLGGPSALEMRALSRAGLLSPEATHHDVSVCMSERAASGAGLLQDVGERGVSSTWSDFPAQAMKAALQKAVDAQYAEDPCSTMFASMTRLSGTPHTARAPSSSPPRQRLQRPQPAPRTGCRSGGGAYGATLTRGASWQQLLRQTSSEPPSRQRSHEPWDQDSVALPPRLRPSRADDWLPTAANGGVPTRRVADVLAPTFLGPAGQLPAMQGVQRGAEFVVDIAGMAADVASDALQLAGEFASIRLGQASVVSELSQQLESFDASRAELCSSRLAEVQRDRVALQSELSKVKQRAAAKTADRDRQLTRVKSERDELVQRLRRTQTHDDVTTRENKKLRSRLAEALQWSAHVPAPPHPDGGASAGARAGASCSAAVAAVATCEGYAGGSCSSTNGGGCGPAGGEAVVAAGSWKQVVFECSAPAAGCEPTRLSASLGVRAAAGAEEEPPRSPRLTTEASPVPQMLAAPRYVSSVVLAAASPQPPSQPRGEASPVSAAHPSLAQHARAKPQPWRAAAGPAWVPRPRRPGTWHCSVVEPGLP